MSLSFADICRNVMLGCAATFLVIVLCWFIGLVIINTIGSIRDNWRG